MTDQELVKAVVEALQAHHEEECLVTPEHCKVCDGDDAWH